MGAITSNAGYVGTDTKKSKFPTIVILILALLAVSAYFAYSSGGFGDPGNFQQCKTPPGQELRSTESVVISPQPTKLILELYDNNQYIGLVTYSLKEFQAYSAWEASVGINSQFLHQGYGTRLLFEGDRVIRSQYGSGFYRLFNTRKYPWTNFLDSRKSNVIEKSGRITVYYCP
jgi:hypothetical protein